MKLTGLPLIILTAVLAALVIAATVLLWSRFGQWRLVSRGVGIVLAEALVVLVIGLVVNRVDGFYPSWQALGGDTGTASETVAAPVGRLDATLGRTSALPWRPVDVASWRLTTAPTVVLPVGYRDRPSVTYPVVLVLADGPSEVTAAVRAAERADQVVTVVTTPTAGTGAAALAGIADDLSRDVRVNTRGWGLITTTHGASLAAGLINGVPGRYAGEALIGPALPAGLHPAGSVAYAVVHEGASAVPSGPPVSSAPPVTPHHTTKPPVVPHHTTKPPVAPHRTTKPHVAPHRSAGAPFVPPLSTLPPALPGSTAGKPAPGGVVTLTCPRGSLWAGALRWAADQTSSPLKPAILLPVGVR